MTDKAFSVTQFVDIVNLSFEQFESVAVEGEILGKPKGIEHVRSMMQQLQGRVHQVYTGVTIAVTEGDAKRVVSF